MNEFTIYHNPKCSKSRETLALLQARGVEPRVIDYLKTPPTAAELRAIVDKLGIKAEQLLRKGEDIYKAKYAGKTLTKAQWIEAMVEIPDPDRAADCRAWRKGRDRPACGGRTGPH